MDGELGHESRDRVLAHLATCARCKAEADAQRRLKNVFAQAAPPPPSESFLARLQGLSAGGGPDEGDDAPFGGSGFPGGLNGRAGVTGVFGLKRGERFEFAYVPAGSHASALAPPPAGRGPRIHDVSRHEPERSASRGLRFAFVAAGAVSLAAIALGGVTTVTPADTGADARGRSGAGSNVTPPRTQGAASTAPENQRRRGLGPLARGQSPLGDTPAAPTEISAQLREGIHSLTAPVMAGEAAMSPLIRPLSVTQPFVLTAWSGAPDQLATAPGTTSSPTVCPTSRPLPPDSP